MSRTIKFKCWEKENNQMLTMDYLNLTVCNNHPDEYVLLQFTGLKDKNSVEIFEGDMLEFTYTTGGTDVRTVVYSEINSCFTLKTSYGALDIFGLQKDWCDRYRVIGNIFENPELIENQE